jgi:UDP-glucose 4-epimerase
MDYLVTGGAGFIGSNIAEYLVRQGHGVRVFDNFSSGKRDNVHSFADKAEIVEGDLRDPRSIRQAVTGVRFVLHLGAMPSVTRSVEDPATTHEANVTGTLNLLLAAREAGVQRVVFTSSSSVYRSEGVV